MTKREVVRLAVQGERPPYVPWQFSFTVEAEAKLQAYYGQADLESTLHNHFTTLGNGIGFFDDIGDQCVRDVFGVVWDRSVDQDIGIVKGQVLDQPTLRGYHFPIRSIVAFLTTFRTSWPPIRIAIVSSRLGSRSMSVPGHCGACRRCSWTSTMNRVSCTS